MKENTLISTIGELKEHKNEILVFYHYLGHYAWMGKFMDICIQPYNRDHNSIRGKKLRVEDMITIGNRYGSTEKPKRLSGERCDAQDHIRIPTKEEMNIYRNLLRHKRIFGV